MELEEVSVTPLSNERFAGLYDEPRWQAQQAAGAAHRRLTSGQTVWTVNSTAAGGGVAEMLQVTVAYALGVGINTRWLVMRGDGEFFAITKRLHNWLHGSPGDGSSLGGAERDHYASVTQANAEALCDRIREGELVVLHDPQTAGMIPLLRERGARVVWRCHVGADEFEGYAERAWEFLRPFLAGAHRHVFSRAEYVPPWLDPGDVAIITPNIDPFSAKNQDLAPGVVHSILSVAGLVDGEPTDPARFVRRDGTEDFVQRQAIIVRGERPLARDAPLVIQVSRWDRLKDMAGVMRAFADQLPGANAHLALIGPDVSGVADDPEGQQVLEECAAAWDALSPAIRRRVLLVSVPMLDVDENAAIINALQRHATLVVQKSLAEGFGLTVTEAMWKTRPVVASPVGGIKDQIRDGDNGVLLAAPTDLHGLAATLDRLLRDDDEASRLGARARQTVADRFLGDRQNLQWIELLSGVADR